MHEGLGDCHGGGGSDDLQPGGQECDIENNGQDDGLHREVLVVLECVGGALDGGEIYFVRHLVVGTYLT